MLHAAGFQNACLIERSGFAESISYSNDEVKINGKTFGEDFSGKTKAGERDSEGRELSEGQDFFRDSKERDKGVNFLVKTNDF